MMVQQRFLVLAAMLCVGIASSAAGQSPSVLYTFDGPPSIEDWIKGFGTNTVTFSNSIVGELTVVETGAPGSTVAISDGFNRIRESSTVTGGLDLTGLDYLQFDVGHNGANNVNVQFYVQATPSSSFVGLGPDISVAPGINTYQVPLTGLTYPQIAYIRTVGMNIRDHAAMGNLTWTIQEVRSGGTPLTRRDLATHNVGSSDNGLQGAIVNFDGASVLGNTGQNQTGLSHNPNGSGSLQWTDLGGGAGGAVTWANGTAWNGSSFGERLIDVSNYGYVVFRMSATDVLGAGGNVNVQSFFQTGPSFTSQAAGTLALPIDGRFHTLRFPLASVVDRHITQWAGINLGTHANNLLINVDLVRFVVPEPASMALIGLGVISWLGMVRWGRRG